MNFKNSADYSVGGGVLTSLGGMVNRQPATALLSALFGEERPRDMATLLTILVLLLHLSAIVYLLKPEEKIVEAKPLVMAVEMITLAKPQPLVAPPKPTPPPPPEKKPLPKVQPPKPVIKKPPPVVQKAPDFAPVQKYEETPPTPPAPVTPAPPVAAPPAPAKTETFTEANFKANYAHNPKPEYPALAKSRGWQGKVLLKVQVSVEGESEQVSIQQSSGHDMLDESAVDAVQKWKFIPAKRGDTAVASSVLVPIVFKLSE